MKHTYKISTVLFGSALLCISAFASSLDSIPTQPVPGAGLMPPSKADSQEAHELQESQEHAQKLRELANQISAEKNAANKKRLQARHRELLNADEAQKNTNEPTTTPTDQYEQVEKLPF